MSATQEHLLGVRSVNQRDLEAGWGRDYVKAGVKKQASSKC
jgi:hypothetical protein